MVDYRMIAETPYISIPEIGNALMQRQEMQNNPLQQMRQAQVLQQQQIQNRILFMEEQQKIAAEKARRANVEELINMGANGSQAANAANAIPAPPPTAANAFTGVPGPSAAAPAPQGWRPPMALPPEGGNAMATPAPQAAPAPPSRVLYSPEAEGQNAARVQQKQAKMKQAMDVWYPLLVESIKTGKQPMVDVMLRAGRKSPALAEVAAFFGDPDGPENQRLIVTEDGKTHTESPFTSKEQFAALTPMAGNEIVRRALETATPGTYSIDTDGFVVVGGKSVPKIVGFKSILSTEAAHTSDIGKLIRERDAKKAALVASGKTPEEAEKDKDVVSYNAEIKKKSEPKDTAARDKYLDIKTRQDQKDPSVTPQEKSFAMAYEKEKTLGPEAYGAMRLEMLLQNPIGAYDTNTGAVGFVTKKKINRGDAENAAKGLPPRYVGGELATKLKSRNAIMEEIATSSEIARKALNDLKGDFTQGQLMKFADQLKVDDGGKRLTSFLSSNFAKTLTPAEIEYVTAIRNLRESSFSLRTVGGMGQGSDMLRAAISEMIPGPRTPNKKMANSQLDKFDIQVDRLWSGIPGVGAEGTTRRKTVGKAAAGGDIAPAGTKIRTTDGKILTSDGVGGWK